MQDAFFFPLGLPQKWNFCGKRRNNGTDGIFAIKRKFGSGIRDGAKAYVGKLEFWENGFADGLGCDKGKDENGAERHFLCHTRRTLVRRVAKK